MRVESRQFLKGLLASDSPIRATKLVHKNFFILCVGWVLFLSKTFSDLVAAIDILIQSNILILSLRKCT